MPSCRHLPHSLLALVLAGHAMAQVPGTATLIQEAIPAEVQQPSAEFRRLAPLPTAEPATGPGRKSGRAIQIRLVGATLITEQELHAALTPVFDGITTQADAARAAKAIVDAYLARGWLARVTIVPEEYDRVELRIHELYLGQVRIDRAEGSRVTTELAEAFVGRHVVPGSPLPVATIERGTTLLNAIPGVAAASALDLVAGEDKVDLIVRLRDRPLLSGQIVLDNHGLRDVGQTRLGARIAAGNGLGLGEQLIMGAWLHEFSHSESGILSLPLGGDGLQAGLGGARFAYRAGRADPALGLEGVIDHWRGFITYPILTRANHLRQASLGYVQTHLVDDSKLGELSNRRVDHWDMTMAETFSDSRTATRLAFRLSAGRTDLSTNPGDQAADAASSRMDGRFVRLNWRIGHERRLDGGDVLVARLAGQLSDRNLEPSLKMGLGGPDGIRAYPLAEALGDQGIVASLERRTLLRPDVHGSVFVDAGEIVRHRRPWDNTRNRYGLAGVGAGVLWRLPDNYLMRGEAAHQLGDNPARDTADRDSDGHDSRWRLWLSLSKTF